MKKFILKEKTGAWLHFESGGIVSWHNINPAALCAFDSRAEAQEIIDNYGLENTLIVGENFSETFFR